MLALVSEERKHEARAPEPRGQVAAATVAAQRVGGERNVGHHAKCSLTIPGTGLWLLVLSQRALDAVRPTQIVHAWAR